MWWKLILILLFVFAIYFILAWFIAKLLKRQKTIYERKYNYLKMIVECSLIDPINYKNIPSLFDELRSYEMANESDISVLEAEFNERFKDVKPK